MAQEEIIIIQDDDAAFGTSVDANLSAESTAEISAKKKKKKIIIFAAAGVTVIVLLTVLVTLLYKKSHHKDDSSSLNFVENKLQDKQKKILKSSELEKIIAKANYLYTNGNKEEALNLFEQIALYSEGISQYNLGVAQLKEKQYQVALETFKKAIQNNENVCVSAINAAVCAQALNQPEGFKYYVNLAYASLPNEINSPLYSYYYALIQYYKGNNLEALSALNHPNSDEYPEQRQILKAKVNAALGNYYQAIDALSKPSVATNFLPLGLLYANVGDLPLAQKYLSNLAPQSTDIMRQMLALTLVNIKAGQLQEASKQLNLLTNKYPLEIYKPYPINVKLKDSLFDPDIAQASFRKNIDNELWMTYEKIFYFAPYKVFNANSTISYIKKGNANISIDDISSAKEYLEKSSASSVVNYGIAQSIKKALSFRLRDANKQLQSLEKIQPRHSILQYNLALTYAQMGDIQNAYEHFKRSYHLDSNNYLSGIFTIMCAQILHLDNDKFNSILKDNLVNEPSGEDQDLYNTLLYLNENNFSSSSKWLHSTYKERPLYLVMNVIIANKLGKNEIALKSAQKLSSLLPHDIFPQIVYMDTKLKKSDTKQYAKEMLFYIKKQKFNFEDLYYGPYITRYLYTQEALMTGTLYPLQVQLQSVLNTTQASPEDILYTLALTNLFNKKAEEAYSNFNQLIDDYKINDDKTLFFGAIASITAGHHDNAIALLELAKMKNPEFFESRFALGLLYMETKNNKGAAIQLSRISEVGFASNYFTFDIDTEDLYFEKEHHK